MKTHLFHCDTCKRTESGEDLPADWLEAATTVGRNGVVMTKHNHYCSSCYAVQDVAVHPDILTQLHRIADTLPPSYPPPSV